MSTDENTMASLIELMHGGAVSTLEVPCILGEDMYDALKKARQRLADAIPTQDLNQIGSAAFTPIYWSVAEFHNADRCVVHQVKIALTLLRSVCRIWPGHCYQH